MVSAEFGRFCPFIVDANPGKFLTVIGLDKSHDDLGSYVRVGLHPSDATFDPVN